MRAGERVIVLASRNADKLREMRQLCADTPFQVFSALDFPGLPDVIEDGTTALGNASRKAIVTAAFTGEIAVADDTALQIAALNALPDVFASRFAGPRATYADNVELVLELMRGVPDGARQARFVTAALWVDPRPADAGLAGRPRAPLVGSRWLHHPFARSIQVRDPRREAAFWERLAGRHGAWEDYRARRAALLAVQGADAARLSRVLDDLLAPLSGGAADAARPGAVRLPDTRLWTAGEPGAAGEPPTLVTPSGLPDEAPGRAVNEPLWLELSAQAAVLGDILREPLGRDGFGYDPIFRPHGGDRTLAELEAGEKNAISHRGRALRRLLAAATAAYAGAA